MENTRYQTTSNSSRYDPHIKFNIWFIYDYDLPSLPVIRYLMLLSEWQSMYRTGKDLWIQHLSSKRNISVNPITREVETIT